MAKRKAKTWESWEDEFVISRIKAGVHGKDVAEQFTKEFPERDRSDSSVRSRYVVLSDRLRMDEFKAKRAEEALATAKTEIVRAPATPAPPPPEEKGWRKIRAPKRWNPGAGEVLEGTYLGPKQAEGQFGTYTQHLIADNEGRVFFVTGAVIDTLFTTSLAQKGVRVRVVFLGKKESETSDNSYKDFDLFVKDPES